MGLTRSMVLVAVSAAVGSFLFGYDTGVISGALVFIEPEFGLQDDPAIKGLIVVSTLVGAFLGSTVGGRLADLFGRRRPLLMSSLLFVIGGGLMFWSPELVTLIVGRFVVGLAIGVSGVIIPLFIAECAPADVRGTLATFPQLFVSSGILTAYLVDFFISLTAASSWRLMLGVSVAPAVVQFLLALWLPESPRWLVQQGMLPQAVAVLRRLRESDDASEELAQIIAAIKAAGGFVKLPASPEFVSSVSPDVSGLNESMPLLGDAPDETKPANLLTTLGVMLRRADVRRALFVGLGLQIFQQLSGINAVIYYTPFILKEVGINALFEGLGLSEDSSAILGTVITYSLKIPAIFLSMYLMDRAGRRTILLLTLPVLVATMATLAVCSAIDSDDTAKAVISMLAIAFYGCCFSAGLGAIANIVCSEIFPPAFRSLGLSICIMTQWAFNILVSEMFPILQDAIGLTATFSIFGGSCLVAFFFVTAFVPETKGRLLEAAAATEDADRKRRLEDDLAALQH